MLIVLAMIDIDAGRQPDRDGDVLGLRELRLAHRPRCRSGRAGLAGKLDSGTLKLKVAASIVAISSIHLLRVFMDAQQIANDKIMWYVILHLTFVVSAVLLGVLDKISFAAHRKE